MRWNDSVTLLIKWQTGLAVSDIVVCRLVSTGAACTMWWGCRQPRWQWQWRCWWRWVSEWVSESECTPDAGQDVDSWHKHVLSAVHTDSLDWLIWQLWSGVTVVSLAVYVCSSAAVLGLTHTHTQQCQSVRAAGLNLIQFSLATRQVSN